MKWQVLVCVVGLLVAGGVATAQPAPAPSEAAMKEAKKHFKQGKAFQDAGAFDEAIAEYQIAYKTVPLPDLLFNIGQAYRLKGDKRKALEYFRQYTDLQIEGKGADEARMYIATLTRDVKAEDEAAARAAAEAARKAAAEEAARKAEEERRRKDEEERLRSADAETRRQAELERARRLEEERRLEEKRAAEERRRREAEEERRMEEEAARRLSQQPKPAPKAGLGSMRLGALVSGGFGVAALIGGTLFGMQASDLANEVQSAKGTWTPDLAQKDRDGKSAETLQVVFLSVGAVAVGGGVALWFLGAPRAGAEKRAALFPVVSPEMTGLVVSGGF